jgi:diacylglycerol kinase
MMTFNSRLANKAIERILELSADAHIERHSAAKDSPEFHTLTGVITAYGKALSLLVELQQRDEFYAMICGLDLPEPGSELVH